MGYLEEPYEMTRESRTALENNGIDRMSKMADGVNDKWLQYCYTQGKNSSDMINPHMFPLYQGAIATVFEHLVDPEQIILFKQDDRMEFGRVLTCVDDTLQVEIETTENRERVWVEANEIVMDQDIVKEMLEERKKENKFPYEEYYLYNPEHFQAAKEHFKQKVKDIVKSGMWLEIQTDSNPQKVSFAKVIYNNYGFLYVLMDGKKFYIHMLNPFVHEVGWARSQDPYYDGSIEQQVYYSESCEKIDFKQIMKETAPAFIFRKNKLQRHNVKEGKILAVAIKGRRNYVYAHVKKCVNAHFFTVSVETLSDAGIQLEGNNVYHIHDPRVFPAHHLEHQGMNVLITENVYTSSDKTTNAEKYFEASAFSSGFVSKCGLTDLTKSRRKSNKTGDLSFRYLEILNTDGTGFYAGEVVKTAGDLVWIHLNSKPELIVVHRSDPQLFPCATCDKTGFPITFKQPEKQDLRVEDNKTTDITPFIRRDDDARQIIHRPFISTQDVIVPKLYFNKKCRIGSYLSKTKLTKWPKYFCSCRYDEQMKTVYEAIMISLNTGCRTAVAHIFQKPLIDDEEEKIASIQIKVKKGIQTFREIHRVPLCDSAELMPEFIRSMLLSLGACPYMLSYKKYKNDVCPCQCDQQNDSQDEQDERIQDFEDMMEDEEYESVAMEKKRLLSNLNGILFHKQANGQSGSTNEIEERGLDEDGIQVLDGKEPNLGDVEEEKELHSKIQVVEEVADDGDSDVQIIEQDLDEDSDGQSIVDDHFRSFERIMAQSETNTCPILSPNAHSPYSARSPESSHDHHSSSSTPPPEPVEELSASERAEQEQWEREQIRMKRIHDQQEMLKQQEAEQKRQSQIDSSATAQFSSVLNPTSPPKPYQQLQLPTFPVASTSSTRRSRAPSDCQPSTSHMGPPPEKMPRLDIRTDSDYVVINNKSRSGSSSNGPPSQSHTPTPTFHSNRPSPSGTTKTYQRIRKPPIEEFMQWSHEEVIEYCKTNLLNMGSEAIKSLSLLGLTGRTLIQLEPKECTSLLGTTNGNILNKFIEFMKKG